MMKSRFLKLTSLLALFAVMAYACAGSQSIESLNSDVNLAATVKKEFNHQEVVTTLGGGDKRFVKVKFYDFDQMASMAESDLEELAEDVRNHLVSTYPFLKNYRRINIGFTSLSDKDSDAEKDFRLKL